TPYVYLNSECVGVAGRAYAIQRFNAISALAFLIAIINLIYYIITNIYNNIVTNNINNIFIENINIIVILINI
ncbi:hypothetical protein, partial [Campylobacter concisus]